MKTCCWSFGLILCLIVAGMVAIAPRVSAAEHSPTLDNLLAITPADQPVAVILFLENRLTMDDVYPVARSLSMSERREYVVHALQNRFDEMSPRVLEQLTTAQKEGSVTLLRPLWILNAIRVSLTPDALARVETNFPEVTYVANDAVCENVLDDGWGVLEIGAPEVWGDLGVDGSGVIVGHKDTGVDWDHSGFEGHIWINPGEDLNHNGHIDEPEEVNNVDDDGNGYVDDFRGWNFDDNDNNVADWNGHGTKTGSVISANPTPCTVVSVAPGAKLMVLRGTTTQGAGFEASQYAALMGAQVISQSFSFKQTDCGEYRDCPNYVAHRWVSEIELAAGIIHANSTGNEASFNDVPLCAATPSNCPPPAMTPFHEQQGGVSSVVGVAAYFQGGVYYTGSGHGPSAWSHEDICVDPRMPFCGPGQYPAEFEDYPYHNNALPGLTKPDITAPTNAASLSNGGGCSSIGGTSGATPHVGGTLALIYSAFPGITPEDAYHVLVNGAEDAGAAGFDTLWGFGKLRAFAACSLGLATRASVSGIVQDGNGDPLPGARVTTDSVIPQFSDASGFYLLAVSTGQHVVRFEKYGYQDLTINVESTPGEQETQNVTLAVAAAASVSGGVVADGAFQPGVPVSVPEMSLELVTDANGQFSIPNTFAGTYDFITGGLPWETRTFTVTLPAGPTQVQFDLERSPLAMTSGPDDYGYYIYDSYDADLSGHEWIEINPNQGGQGTNLNLSADNSTVRTLPFNVEFYGQTYNSITIMANGFVMFGSTSSNEWGSVPIPVPGAPDGFVMPFFTDWVPQSGGGVFYYADTVNHRVVVEWWNVIDYFEICRATFEVIITEPGFPVTPTGDSEIICQYEMVNGRFEGTVGIENASGTDGIQYEFQMFYDPHGTPIEAGSVLLISTNDALIVDDEHSALPREFSLESNYPNPFNPTTTFVWNAPVTAHVRLALFDVLGRESAVVYEGVADAGRHETTFDASALSTGVYFARLENAGQSVAVRKVLLLK